MSSRAKGSRGGAVPENLVPRLLTIRPQHRCSREHFGHIIATFFAMYCISGTTRLFSEQHKCTALGFIRLQAALSVQRPRRMSHANTRRSSLFGSPKTASHGQRSHYVQYLGLGTGIKNTPYYITKPIEYVPGGEKRERGGEPCIFLCFAGERLLPCAPREKHEISECFTLRLRDDQYTDAIQDTDY